MFSKKGTTKVKAKGIRKAFRFRIYPTEHQQELLAQQLGCCRFIYNHLLEYRSAAYKDTKKSISVVDCNKYITELRHDKERPWLKDAPSQALQQASIDLQRAYNNFFSSSSPAGYPSVKKRRNRSSLRVCHGFSVDPSKNIIKMPKVGAIKTKFHRSIKGTTIKSATLIKEPSGKYYISLCVIADAVAQPPITKLSADTKTVGIDLGLKDLIVTSDGYKSNNPKYYRQSEAKLAKAQRKLSKRVKKSNNYRKQRIKVARIHEHIRNQRKDFTHKLTHKLVNENQVICSESLNVKGMVKNHHLAKSISDANWSELTRQLDYKSKWHGSLYLKVGRWFASSKLCSTLGCDYKYKDLKLSVRSWICPECGCHHDRDTNASVNVLTVGMEESKLEGVVRYFQTLVESKTSALRSKDLKVSLLAETRSYAADLVS